MSLSPGRDLSHYRLIEPIGEGGMGVVWKAIDTTLHRDVAIKVLPELFAQDPERLARFEREARVLASLNHPHIASIYGLHTADGVRFLAMELVEGEDLAQRLARGPLPLAEALPLALQIAQALELAHEKGIIHRDLKPANVKLTAAGAAKVLDFGLAKALEGETGRPSSSSVMSQSPTITGHMTAANVLLGTAAYMAPEQARGHVADRRADIWAFGVLLMEMLTGQRLFDGETISDTLAAVLKTDPDWSRLPKETPQRIRALLRRCLERDPRKRLRDIGEARITLEEAIAGAPEDAPVLDAAARRDAALRPLGRKSIAITLFQVVVVSVVSVLATRLIDRPRSAPPVVKFRLSAPVEAAGPPRDPALSPDGRMVAYLAGDRLWIQTLGELEPREARVNPGASDLFWSPDAKHVGYIAGTRIMKISIGGGENQAVCDVRAALTGGAGAAWGDKGNVVFSRGDSAGLLEVPALGGDPRTLVPVDSSEGDLHEPSYLPGGRGILFASHRRSGGIDKLQLWSGGKRKLLLELPGQTISTPVYSSTGHILFRRTPTTPGIWALPFSLRALKVTGEPFLVVPNGSAPSVSREGWLACSGADAATALQLAWVDRTGKDLASVGEAQVSTGRLPVLAHDRARIAMSVTDSDNEDIWIFDSVRGTRTRLTFEPGGEACPAWSSDGQRIAYHAHPRGCTSSPECYSVLVRPADGTGMPDTVGRLAALPNFSPDGKYLVYTEFGRTLGDWNLALAPLEGVRKTSILVRGNPRAVDGRVRPSGDLMAYMSDESGEWQVYLTRFPSAQGRWQVSVSGGEWPRWSAKGDRLYFAQGEDLMEVAVAGVDVPSLGRPEKLFTRPATGQSAFGWYTGYDATTDGSRFVIMRPAGDRARPPSVTVIQNWFSEFKHTR
jgi:eukaryotic-like serine/threonine-protein kinase